MTKWNDISTVDYSARGRALRVTKELLFWVQSEHMYQGPIVGMLLRYTRKDGELLESFCASGVSGEDMVIDFSTDDITHWAELPEWPK